MNAPSLDMTKLQASMSKIEVESALDAIRGDMKNLSISIAELKKGFETLYLRLEELEKKNKPIVKKTVEEKEKKGGEKK